MDSMLDTLTNVVGILLIVLVTVQLSTQEAAERIAEAVEKLAPEEIARIEQEAAKAKAAADAAQARLDAIDRPPPRDPAAEAARLEAESVKSDQAARDAATRAAALEKEKREKSETARKAAEDRRVHECQTPVFLWTEVDDAGTRLIAEVAPEAPTVKGFVAILAEAIAGRPPAEAASLSDDILERMGLADVLGMMRARGLHAIVNRVRRELLGLAGPARPGRSQEATP